MMRKLTLLLILTLTACAHGGPLEDSGVTGGLIVVIGCDDAKLIAQLGASDKFLVQALDTDPAKVAKLRDTLGGAESYGRISASVFDGKTLPYADNLVNLLIGGAVPAAEVNRVLAPRGVSIVGGKKSVKPVPDDIAEWSHYLYDSKNNAVSDDKKVSTPVSMQWVSGPRWSRHHDHMSSISAVVSATGRIFSILDEGPKASIQYPAQWRLVARDAFNGKLLWKRKIEQWHTDIWPAKAGPAQLPRRLVAVGDKVYATLGLHAPVTMLDAATGQTLKTFDDTQHAEELIVDGGQLLVTAHAKAPPEGKWRLKTPQCWTETRRSNSSRPWKWEPGDPKKIIAVDIASGDVLWSKEASVAPITLGADAKHVVYHNGMNVVCLDRKSGKELWTSQKNMKVQALVKSAPNLVIYKDVVLFSAGPGTISSLSIKDGKVLWSDFHGPTGHQSTFDLQVADGLVWSITGRQPRRPKKRAKGAKPKPKPNAKPKPKTKVVRYPGWTFFGRDPVTGETKKTFPPGRSDWFHHRCHRGRGTNRYLIMSRTGLEYIDLQTGKWQPNPWVRGACLYGMMPANGLSYAPPHPCACYIESKLNGFNALVGADAQTKPAGKPGPRLETGPAYEKVAKSSGGGGWRTYRGDNMRSGSNETAVPAKLKTGWTKKLGGKLSPVTVAGGKVFIAAVDRHTVYALDSKTGAVAWKYVAGGRVDTPPTIAGDLCIFGCRDGWIYCLSAADGKLSWRYRAVEQERTIVSYDQLESTWPVSGAVLVQDGSIYCVAGRSMFLDGGLHLLKLDAATGKLQFEEIMGDTLPGGDKPLHTTARSLDMPVALPDILSSDGKRLYMRSQSIGMDGKRTSVAASGPFDQGGPEAHLVCSSGYLDDTWFHRAYWVFGHGYGTGHNGWFRAGRFAPAGRMLVFDKDSVFGYGRKPNMYVWSSALEYQLYSAERDVKPEAIKRVVATNRRQEGKQGHIITFDRKMYGAHPLPDISAIDFKWRKENPPIQARAMALAGKTLLVAGPVDVVDEEEVFSNPFDKDLAVKAGKQVDGLKGKGAAMLLSVSAESGKKLGELKLDASPVFDGLATDGGKLFIVTMDGSVMCCE
ncbi:MAG: PQQ-binding-like beta-propeller repeat protein [Phycisphaerae bacterium]|jgi:outer membrane protein assembly factor BamB|nr:PQQ-binding-like beta-propeller repeat protein [Phycisphaerae bacterium]